jgi:tetratricopeptide (TPR) repeat protein
VAADSDSTNERVRILFRDGNAQMVAGDYEKARSTLLQAWAMRQSSDIAAALGQVEFATLRFREAAEHLQWSLDHFPPVESEKSLRATRALFEQAKQGVARLRITCNYQGASILVDGKVVGTTPMQTTVFVEPGQHQVEALAAETRDNRLIAADPGKEYGIDFVIKQPAPSLGNGPTFTSELLASQQPAQTKPAPRQLSALDRSVVPVLIGGAVFAVGLGTGVALLASSRSSYHDAEALQRQIGPAGCLNSANNQMACADLRSATDKGDQRQNWGAVSLAVASAALIATPIYWYWPHKNTEQPTSRAQLRIRGSVASKYSGLSLVGEF